LKRDRAGKRHKKRPMTIKTMGTILVTDAPPLEPFYSDPSLKFYRPYLSLTGTKVRSPRIVPVVMMLGHAAN
jgi:hypothetical protein